MSLYFFDISDAYPDVPCEGQHLASLSEARCHAIKYAGQILCDQKPAFWDEDEWVMTVSDADHLTLFTLTISTMNAPATAGSARLVSG
jgi:hypothetical protein